MRTSRRALILGCAVSLMASSPALAQQRPGAAAPGNARVEALKSDAIAEVEKLNGLTQQMVDSLFSFGELGFQEHETARYCTEILTSNGFKVERNVAGMPTAWVATFGSGKPVIAIGSDIDGLAGTSQKPGLPYRAPFIENGPGHGEGHNTGVPLSITAAVAVKRIMEREKIQGTIKVWPGVAEELLAGKAHLVRAGVFTDVDVVLFSHIASSFGVSWGPRAGSGLMSVEYVFEGVTAHAGGAPWQGRSALDAVMLMEMGWNFRREHLRLQQRSHMVVTDGGGQPNVVPGRASAWYYFREIDYPHIKELKNLGDTIAQAAAMMTGTTVTSTVLGTAWPQHMNRPVAEAVYANIQRVGMPQWSDDDQTFAKIVQRAMKARDTGLNTRVGDLGTPADPARNMGGGSDDIGDVSWNVPTITLSYPGNIPGMQGHHWSSAIAEATPVAHKGASAGAKVHAANMIDLLLRPDLVQAAWDYFKTVQAKEGTYTSLLAPTDKPAVWLNERAMREANAELRKYYYDPTRYKTYLEQLGIPYPPIEKK